MLQADKFIEIVENPKILPKSLYKDLHVFHGTESMYHSIQIEFQNRLTFTVAFDDRGGRGVVRKKGHEANKSLFTFPVEFFARTWHSDGQGSLYSLDFLFLAMLKAAHSHHKFEPLNWQDINYHAVTVQTDGNDVNSYAIYRTKSAANATMKNELSQTKEAYKDEGTVLWVQRDRLAWHINYEVPRTMGNLIISHHTEPLSANQIVDNIISAEIEFNPGQESIQFDYVADLI